MFEEMAKNAPTSLNENQKCILGVDRLDYTKGLVNRMLCIEKLLDEYPEHIEKVIYLQVHININILLWYDVSRIPKRIIILNRM